MIENKGIKITDNQANFFCSLSIFLYVQLPARDPGKTPTAAVTFATSGERPKATRVGKTIKVPPPATTFKNPLAIPASRAMNKSINYFLIKRHETGSNDAAKAALIASPIKKGTTPFSNA